MMPEELEGSQFYGSGHCLGKCCSMLFVFNIKSSLGGKERDLAALTAERRLPLLETPPIRAGIDIQTVLIKKPSKGCPLSSGVVRAVR